MIQTENRQYIKDIAYQTADEFLHDISYGGKLYKLFERNFIFRGHSSNKYKYNLMLYEKICIIESMELKKR